MSALGAWLLGSPAHAFAFDVAGLATLAAGLGVLVALLARRASAPLRKIVLATSLVLAAASPLVAWILETSRIGLFRMETPRTAGASPDLVLSHGAEPPGTSRTPQTGNPLAGGSPRGPETRPVAAGTTSAARGSWVFQGAMAVWALGSLVGFVRIVRGLRLVRRMSRGLCPADGPEVVRAAGRAGAALGIEVMPRVLASEDVPIPLAVGLARPAIVLPARAPATLGDEELLGVVLHEMAHVVHRDPWMGLFQRIVVAGFWWNPLVRAASARLSEAQEEVCDNHVRQALGGGERFARCLVGFLEGPRPARAAALASGLLCEGRGLESRIRKLLMTTVDVRTSLGRRGILCAGVFLLGSLSALGLAHFRAQESAAAAKGGGGPQYLPLAEGAVWRYRFLGDAGAVVENSFEVVRPIPAAKPECFELRTRQGAAPGWAYFGVKPDGVYEFRNRYLGGLRGVNLDRTPRRILACPPSKGFTWEWTEEASVQTMAGPDTTEAPPLPDPETMRWHWTGTIEALDDAVSVPAGSYTAVRVKLTAKSGTFGALEETTWWAPGIGRVKWIESGSGGSKYTHELTSCSPGASEMSTPPEEALAVWVFLHPFQGDAKPEVAWLGYAPLDMWFRGRFARLRANDAATLYRIRAGVVTPIDPRSKEDWTALMKDDRIELSRGLEGGSDQAAADVALACAYLAGMSRDPSPAPKLRIEPAPTTIDMNTGTFTVGATVSGTTADGAAWSETIEMVLEKDAVKSLKASYRGP